MQQQQYIDQRQDNLEEVEPILLEGMSYIQPARSLNQINGSVLTEDEGGQARFYPWNSEWVLIRTLRGNPSNPIILYYRTADEVVIGIVESDPWYIEVQTERNGPHVVLWDVRAQHTGIEEMFRGLQVH